MPDGTSRQLVFEKGAKLSKVEERVSHAFGVGQHVKLDCGVNAISDCLPTGLDNVKVVPLVAPRTLCDVIPAINATPLRTATPSVIVTVARAAHPQCVPFPP